jgi:hypothetical protein
VTSKVYGHLDRTAGRAASDAMGKLLAQEDHREDGGCVFRRAFSRAIDLIGRTSPAGLHLRVRCGVTDEVPM